MKKIELVVVWAICTPVFGGAVLGPEGDLKSARRDCAELGKVVEELEAKGGGQYSRATYEVVRYSLDAMENFDLPRGLTNRVMREAGNLRKEFAETNPAGGL